MQTFPALAAFLVQRVWRKEKQMLYFWNKRLALGALLGLVLLLNACAVTAQASASQAEQGTKQTDLVVAAAASLQDCLVDIARHYATVDPSVRLVFNFASSGTLQAQIEEGAPVDVFISAAPHQVQVLNDSGLILSDSIQTIAGNSLVLIIPAKSNLEIQAIADLSDMDVTRLAIGDPASVPAGNYAQQVLGYFGLEESLGDRLVLGSDVRQVLAWVQAGEVDAGFVYASDAAITDQIRMVAMAPADSHTAIVYPAAIIQTSSQETAARQWLEFLCSEPARLIFAQYGFTKG